MGRNENMSGSVFVPSSEEIEPYEEGETAANDQRAPKESHKTVTCFECGKQRNYKKDCPKLKNRGRENSEARGRVYELGENNANPDSNVVTSTFLLNNRYASILFDTGVDRSFMSTTFSFLINIIPFTLDHSHGVELADGKIIGVNTIIRGCTLVKDNKERTKSEQNRIENEKRGSAQQGQSPVTVEKAEKRRNTDSRDQYWQILEV
nr:putative reverse transcriptase domain-containing protein [Tanacetum cinerariifolium]